MEMNQTISPSEWEIMKVAWSNDQVTNNYIFEVLSEKMDWKMSTVKTLVRRLTDKGYLSAEKNSRQFVYKPLINQDEAYLSAGEDFLDSVCNRKVGGILTKLVKEYDISQDDLDDLIKVAQEKKESAPEQVACHCLPGQCTCSTCQTQKTR